ncbi:dipicolinate synthase subunit B [Clostridia bacterium]|nr:dipicolinate synthase subunit B [Clostridia bacterium]
MKSKRLGFALTGSFCTIPQIFPQIELLAREYASVTPIISPKVGTIDTRFGTAQSVIEKLESITGNAVINSIISAEPIGPTHMFDCLIIAPTTGNTLAKLACGIADTTVTMATKSHLRNSRPLVLAISTNDGLSTNAKNIGTLLARKHVYFVPFGQDDAESKPHSLISNMSLLPQTIASSLAGVQLQPLLHAHITPQIQ